MAVGDECNQDGVKEKGGETTEVVEEQIGQVLLLTLVCIPSVGPSVNPKITKNCLCGLFTYYVSRRRREAQLFERAPRRNI